MASSRHDQGNPGDDRYRVLALTGAGSWNPARDAHLWLKFNFRAHHMQAQTLRRRINHAERIWTRLDELTAEHGLPDRLADVLYEAVLGYRVRRSGYIKRTQLERRTASRDLARAVDLGLLNPVGETRGRHYVAGEVLAELRTELHQNRARLEDPYPWIPAELRKSDQATDH